MRILIVGEGKHEGGGALLALIGRVAGTGHQYEWDRVSNPAIHAHHGKGQGFFKRAVRWMLEARRRGFDALVLVVDEDGFPARSKEIAAAQGYVLDGFRRALGVAIRTFDAWMLADEQALAVALGVNVPKQPDPESISDPKRRCAELLNTSGALMPQAEMYARVAAVVDLAVLNNRCPKGFAPFYEHLRGI